ncbi:hypothetical protein LMORI2_05380 [Limnohabitans sp. MORI2]|jgi:hypothetical protein|uniref:hypothetical protein n=1 Tax=Limnohabitans sp. MORI2 TaxID=1751150 RepID=UPI002376E1C4|nr:hypothetical protein [Limnohabitans sp. MORI2]BDU57556.1 hypothetical protein LMORI2_05380 [Limnohabitans sp. MORI2]
MADEQTTSTDAAQEAAEAIVDVEATAERLTEIASQSLDTNEVARQIEELTSVVLDSAEVSTRSASIAADVSATMRAVVSKIQENNRRNVMHSRIMLGAFCACLLIAMGIFFAITMKMTKSIKELDTMVYAMAKRVIEVDASLTAIGKTNSDFSEITEKQEEVITTQTQVAKRLEELGKSLAAMPTVVATEANKSSDLKFKDMQKQLSTMESKLQSFDGKLQTVAEKAMARVQPAPPPAPVAAQGPSTQVLLTEIQKLKSDLNAAMQNRERVQSAAEVTALKNIDKNLEKAAIVAGEAQKAADKAALAAKASAQSEKAAADAQRAALEAQRSAAASEKAAAAERIAQQRAAAERAVAMRMQPEKPVKSAEQIAEEKAAAERAAAVRAAKAASEKAAADRAAAAAERAAAEKAKAAAAAAAAAPVREKPIQYPRVPD